MSQAASSAAVHYVPDRFHSPFTWCGRVALRPWDPTPELGYRVTARRYTDDLADVSCSACLLKLEFRFGKVEAPTNWSYRDRSHKRKAAPA